MKTFLYALLIVGVFAGCALNRHVVETPEPAADPVEMTSAPIEPPEAVESSTRPGTNTVVDAANSVPPVLEPTVPQMDEDLANGLTLFEEGKLRGARTSLTAALDNSLNAEDEGRALDALKQINRKVFLSTGDDGDLEIYTVQAGDTLGKIAQSFSTTYEMLQRLNGLKNSRIRVGQTLKILGGDFELVVRKGKFVMDLLLDGQFIKRYTVGLGVDGCTPLGEFTVKNRIPKPADGSWPHGHPKHRLGSHWLGLKSEAGHKGYGIHGCRPSENDQLGGECSKGCVRMTNEDVAEVFDIVPVGTVLRVIE